MAVRLHLPDHDGVHLRRFTAFGLLAGTSSLNENAESADTLVDQGELLSAPTESGTPRRLLLICFSLGLVVAGMVGVAILG